MEVLVSTAAYAKYGLVSGTIVESPELVVECILVCKGWPSWAFGAQGAGFNIQVLIMLDPYWVSLASVLLPTIPVVSYADSAAAS